MTKSARYVKIVEWSEQDRSYVGYCPGIIGPCCHGDDEVEVFRNLCTIVDEWLELLDREHKALPAPTIGKSVAGFLCDGADLVQQKTVHNLR